MLPLLRQLSAGSLRLTKRSSKQRDDIAATDVNVSIETHTSTGQLFSAELGVDSPSTKLFGEASHVASPVRTGASKGQGLLRQLSAGSLRLTKWSSKKREAAATGSTESTEIHVGDTVRTSKGQGQVLTRQGLRIRIKYANATAWAEISTVLSVVARGQTDAAGAPDGSNAPHNAALETRVLFQLIDRNQNGFIDRAEFMAFVLPRISDNATIGAWWAALVAEQGETTGNDGPRITEACFCRWANLLPPDARQMMERSRSLLPTAGDSDSQDHDYQLDDCLLIVTPEGALVDGRFISAAHANGPLTVQISGENLELERGLVRCCRQRLSSLAAYRSAILSYCADLEACTSVLEDGITGVQLRTQDQLLAIDVSTTGVMREGISDAPNVKALCAPLLAGAQRDLPAVLVCAGPGTGKTWSSVQLTHSLAQQCQQQVTDDAPWVPVLVYVQRVSRMLEGSDPNRPLDVSTLLQYFAIEYAKSEEWLLMLTMALEMRRLVIVLDGIDEAAGRKRTISIFVREVLAPSGLRVVCTSRPEGVKLKDFASRFVIFNLKPLDEEQQRRALEQQLLQTGSALAVHREMGAEVRILSSLDDRLIAALLAGDLRFVRSAWLIQQPDDYRIERRQVLEERERNGETPSPLLSPEEGAKLLRCADRRGGAVTYGWETVTHPDPSGARLQMLRRALQAHDHIEGFFWDMPSLYQHPPDGSRTEDEESSFLRGLGVMGDLYASAVGVTVLKIKEVSPAPANAKGHLHLFGICEGVDEERLRNTFEMNGTIVNCSIGARQASGWQQAVVTFTTHAAALKAKAAGPPAGVCTGLSPFYNERPYDDRGWCSFEEIVSNELIMRLQQFDSVRNALCSLPPKVLSLSSENPAGEAATLAESAPASNGHVARAEQRLRDATFTNGSLDKERVVKLYGDYVQRVEQVLTKSVEFIEEVKGVPVLLSILILVFKNREAGSTEPLPANRYKLYEMATRLAVREQAEHLPEEVGGMLSRIARFNHTMRRREFTTAQVEEALMGGSSISQLRRWTSMARTNEGIPLIKTLVDAGGGKQGVYQFRHLSFQEGLFAVDMAQGEGAALLPNTLHQQLFKEGPDAWFRNSFAIGGGRIRVAICAEGRAKGYAAGEAKAVGYTLEEMRAAGFTCKEVKAVGYTLEEMRAAGYTCMEAKAVGYTLEEMRSAGYGARSAEAASYSTLGEARAAGYTLEEMRAAGFTCKEAKAVGYTLEEMRAAGFTYNEARAAGYTLEEAKGVGFTCREAKAAGHTLEEMRAAGFTCKEARVAGYTLAKMRAAGYTCKEAKAAGYTLEEMRSAGYRARSAEVASYGTLGEARAAGCTLEEMRAAGFTCKEARAAGYTLEEIRTAGFTCMEAKGVGYNLEEMKSAGYGARAAEAANYSTLGEAKASGYTCEEAKAAGYSFAEAKDAGYTRRDMSGDADEMAPWYYEEASAKRW